MTQVSGAAGTAGDTATIEMDVDVDGKADFRIAVDGHDLTGKTGYISFHIGMGGSVLSRGGP